MELPDGPIDEAMIATMVSLFHDQYERRYGNRFDFVPVQGVTYRVQLIVPSEKVEYARSRTGDGARWSRTAAGAALLRRGRARGRRVRARGPAGRARVIGPAIIREDLSTTFVCPQQTAKIGSFGEIVIEQAVTGR